MLNFFYGIEIFVIFDFWYGDPGFRENAFPCNCFYWPAAPNLKSEENHGTRGVSRDNRLQRDRQRVRSHRRRPGDVVVQKNKIFIQRRSLRHRRTYWCWRWIGRCSLAPYSDSRMKIRNLMFEKSSYTYYPDIPILLFVYNVIVLSLKINKNV